MSQRGWTRAVAELAEIGRNHWRHPNRCAAPGRGWSSQGAGPRSLDWDVPDLCKTLMTATGSPPWLPVGVRPAEVAL